MKAIFWFLTTSLLCVGFCNAQKFDLALNLKEGKEYRHVSVTNVSMLTDMGYMKDETTIENRNTMVFSLNHFDEEYYDLDFRYENISISLKSTFENLEYSTDTIIPNDPYSKALNCLLDFPFRILLARNGEVLEIRRPQGLWDSIAGMYPEMRMEDFEDVQFQLEMIFGESKIKEAIELLTNIFPDSPVAIDDKWTIERTMEEEFPMVVATTYQLVEIAEEYAIIKGNSEFIPMDIAELIEDIDVQMDVAVDGLMVSTIKVDRSSGWVFDAIINQELSVFLSMEPTEEMPGGMQFSIQVFTETRVDE